MPDGLKVHSHSHEYEFEYPCELLVIVFARIATATVLSDFVPDFGSICFAHAQYNG